MRLAVNGFMRKNVERRNWDGSRDFSPERGMKMVECKHKKWHKWEECFNKEGNVVMSRACKKCGWKEYRETHYGNPKTFSGFIKNVVEKTLKDQKPSRKGNDADKNRMDG